MPPPEDHPARHVSPVWYAPHGGPGHDAGAVRQLSVLDSVTAPSFRADLALEHVRANAELVRETLARARDTARRCAEIQATAAELTVIAEDLCSRARAERERRAGTRAAIRQSSDTSPSAAAAVPTAAVRGLR